VVVHGESKTADKEITKEFVGLCINHCVLAVNCVKGCSDIGVLFTVCFRMLKPPREKNTFFYI